MVDKCQYTRRHSTEEDDMLVACVNWADGYFKKHWPMLLLKQTDKNGNTRMVSPLMHAASERKTSPHAGKRLKDKGQRAGFPDLYLPVFFTGQCGLFIELKTRTGRMSVNQKNWAEYFDKWEALANVRYEICRSISEFQAVVIKYMDGKNK